MEHGEDGAPYREHHAAPTPRAGGLSGLCRFGLPRVRPHQQPAEHDRDEEERGHITQQVTLMFGGHRIRAINLGRIFRYIPKPWNNGELRGAIAQAIESATTSTARS